MKKATYLFLLSVLIAAGVVGAVSCGGTAQPTTPAKGDTQVKPPEGQTPGPDYKPGPPVTIENYTYIPATATVAVGTTITWTNQDSVKHTVTERNKLFDSGLLAKGESFSYTFTEKGEYDYYCTLHPYMTGKVIVE
jgi:plastocyanin